MKELIKNKIINNPFRNVKAVAFTDEEINYMKEELSGIYCDLDSMEFGFILALYIKKQILDIVNDEEFFYGEEYEMQKELHAWSRQLNMLIN